MMTLTNQSYEQCPHCRAAKTVGQECSNCGYNDEEPNPVMLLVIVMVGVFILIWTGYIVLDALLLRRP